MKPITKYQSDDGNVFDTAEKCLAYEGMLSRLSEVEFRTLGPKPYSSDFWNGGGYIQHDFDLVDECRSVVKEISKSGEEGSPEFKAICKVLRRLESIDKNTREWGQPYFASNPFTGKQVEFQR